MHPRPRAVAAATTAALTITLTAVATSTASSAFGTPGSSVCRLVELPPPPGGFDAGVLDIEVVDGTTTYYGNYQVMEDGEQRQRAVIWRGLDGAPEPVDTGLGRFADIALELTSTGLANGTSEDPDGSIVNWVLDITTMDLTVVDASVGAAADTTAYARRVNDTGELVGSDVHGVGSGSERRNGFSAVGWDRADESPFRLESTGSMSNAAGINARGDRVGLIAKAKRPQNPHWTDYDPTLWRADGTVVTMDRVGIDAIPWEVKDDGSAAGEGFWGWDTRAGHMEAVYWPTPDEAVGLGVLDGGAYSRVFGLDEGGWAVGGAEVSTDEGDPYFDPWRGGFMHSFLYVHGRTARGHLRVLPTLWSVANDEDDWHQWHGSAVHAVNAPLDQAASASDTGLDEDGVPTYSATVYVNASQCGIEVETTHDPFHLGSLEEARDASEAVTQLATRGPRR
ncbi:hypothetical protein [Knoellia aerolata]|uniref:Uncharacterized protein n=1 Tax=Knoellia aerolata DSM 18566 TaxID=1385519 RepID=A0A0A0JLN9_9MICO|nr:hypothetical protein [Knoellia aerolata]KGN38370.1 hypothetical protein N801_00200 [Knoellia aerolata DSM 18566]